MSYRLRKVSESVHRQDMMNLGSLPMRRLSESVHAQDVAVMGQTDLDTPTKNKLKKASEDFAKIFEMSTFDKVVSTAGFMGGAYHGYKRNNNSVGWAVGWSLIGSLFPKMTILVALLQGFGKPATPKVKAAP